ncbi:hypothetical protein BLOT_012390 [Blomia tropicalis]|nr:hypothetical protein BLOT_012390 [Blomia tropicalis]
MIRLYPNPLVHSHGKNKLPEQQIKTKEFQEKNITRNGGEGSKWGKTSQQSTLSVMSKSVLSKLAKLDSF